MTDAEWAIVARGAALLAVAEYLRPEGEPLDVGRVLAPHFRWLHTGAEEDREALHKWEDPMDLRSISYQMSDAVCAVRYALGTPLGIASPVHRAITAAGSLARILTWESLCAAASHAREEERAAKTREAIPEEVRDWMRHIVCGECDR
jgi:hypothetical protein